MAEIIFQITVDVEDEDYKKIQQSLQDHFTNGISWENFKIYFLKTFKGRKMRFQNWTEKQNSITNGLGSIMMKEPEPGNKTLTIEVIAHK